MDSKFALSLSQKVSQLEQKGIPRNDILDLLKLGASSAKYQPPSPLIQQSLMWNVATAFACIAAGVSMYLLTDENDLSFSNCNEENEEDKFGDRDPTTNNDDENLESDNDIMIINSLESENNVMQRAVLDSKTYMNAYEQPPPQWATELLRITSNMAEELKSLRQELSSRSEKSPSKDLIMNEKTIPGIEPDSAAVPVPVPAPVTHEDRRATLRSALRKFIEMNSKENISISTNTINDNDKNNNIDTEDIKPLDKDEHVNTLLCNESKSNLLPPTSTSVPLQRCCDTLAMYLKKLIESPEIPRYRKIATSNQSFKSFVQALKGHDEVLQSVGFVLKGLYYEWTWVGGQSQSQDSKMGLMLPAANEAKELLQECLRVLEHVKKEGEARKALEMELFKIDNSIVDIKTFINEEIINTNTTLVQTQI